MYLFYWTNRIFMLCFTHKAEIEDIANLWNEVLSIKQMNGELETDITTMKEDIEK